MKVKDFKELLNKFNEEDHIIFKSRSGISWNVNQHETERRLLNKNNKDSVVIIK